MLAHQVPKGKQQLSRVGNPERSKHLPLVTFRPLDQRGDARPALVGDEYTSLAAVTLRGTPLHEAVRLKAPHKLRQGRLFHESKARKRANGLAGATVQARQRAPFGEGESRQRDFPLKFARNPIARLR